MYTVDAQYKTGKYKKYVEPADSFFSANRGKLSPFCYMELYRHKVWYYIQQNNGQDSALMYNDSLREVMEDNDLITKNLNSYIEVYSGRGEIFYAMGNFDSAYDNYFKAKQLAEHSGNTCVLLVHCYGLGMISYRQKKYHEAVGYFKSTFIYAQQCADQPVNQMQESLDNVALSFEKLGLPDSALYYYDSALSYINKNIARFDLPLYAEKGIGVIYGNIGSVYLSKGEVDTAISFFKRSYAINFRRTYEMEDALRVHIKLAGAYFQKDDIKSMSVTLAAISREFDTVAHSTIALKDWNDLMYRYYERIGDAVQALKYYKVYSVLRDSLNDETQKELQADVSKSFKQKEQSYQISLLRKENKVGNIYLWVVIIILLMAIVLITQVYLSYKKSRENINTLTLLNNRVSEQKEELEKRNKEKDRILHVVAHDLRNPVGGILYVAQEMQTDNAPEWKNVDVFGMIAGASESAMVLINELLGYTNTLTSELTRESADVAKLVSDILKLLQFKANEKHQRLRAELPPEAVMAYFNKEYITRVISNLLGNAMKFSKTGATIIVKVASGDDKVLITVQDSGIGIPAEIKDEVFNMFTNAKRFGTAGEKSYGLGLSICKQIVEAHGGKIWFESEEGRGATFFVELPRSVA